MRNLHLMPSSTFWHYKYLIKPNQQSNQNKSTPSSYLYDPINIQENLIMLSSSLRLLIFLLCLSLHACNARRLGSFVTLQNSNNEVQFISKDADDGVNVGKPGLQEEINGSHMEIHDEFIHGAKTMKQKLLKVLSEAKQTISRLYSGYEITTSSEDDLQKIATKDQGLKRHGRSMIGTPLRNAEATASYEEKEAEEDIGVMDYAQPHRKPPIHNEKH